MMMSWLTLLGVLDARSLDAKLLGLNAAIVRLTIGYRSRLWRPFKGAPHQLPIRVVHFPMHGSP